MVKSLSRSLAETDDGEEPVVYPLEITRAAALPPPLADVDEPFILLPEEEEDEDEEADATHLSRESTVLATDAADFPSNTTFCAQRSSLATPNLRQASRKFSTFLAHLA